MIRCASCPAAGSAGRPWAEDQRAQELGSGDEADPQDRVRELEGQDDLSSVLQPGAEVGSHTAREIQPEPGLGTDDLPGRTLWVQRFPGAPRVCGRSQYRGPDIPGSVGLTCGPGRCSWPAARRQPRR